MKTVELSVVIPAYNEAMLLPKLAAQLRQILGELDLEYEVLIVNDGSTDPTEAVLDALCAEDQRLVPVHLARNFGKEAALAAGLAAAAGQAIIFLDADLQHPPELIPDLVREWRSGFDVVNAVKRSRADESSIYRWFSMLFNRLMTREIGRDMAGASDFKLIDRQVADVLLACPERNRFFRGLVAWVGFRVRNLEFDVRARERGNTRWSTLSLIRYSVSSMMAFSSLPLRAVGYAGFVVAGLGALLLAQTLIRYAMGVSAIGFTTVIAVQVLLGGMILMALGVISLYLSNLYEEQKGRPVYIVRKPRAGAGRPQ
jgi:polyisoprenyl-phosphate glycosyltransferase